MNKILSFFKSNSKVALMGLLLVGLFMVSGVSMADDITTVATRGSTDLPYVAKFFVGLFFVLAVFAGGMFGYKIYQHGKDQREHKLSHAFIYLAAAGALISAGYLVDTMANTLGTTTKGDITGDYSSFTQ
jgi:hypothetical protein